jgi:colicin import membrane protein
MKVFVWLSSVVCLTAVAQAQTTKQTRTPVSGAEVAQMRDTISSCLRKHWRLPKTGQSVLVTVRWELGKDGKLLGSPRIVGQETTPDIMPSAKQAIRAVRACEPFKLPAARYQVWKTITWDFDPTMTGN